MSYVKDLPEIHFGTVKEEPVDWRADKETEDDEDAPASEALIEMLGFDPDKYQEESTLDSIRAEVADLKLELNEIRRRQDVRN